MADEAVRAPALGGVTERLDAQYDAHGADDDDVPITRSEGTKQCLCVFAFYDKATTLYSAASPNQVIKINAYSTLYAYSHT